MADTCKNCNVIINGEQCSCESVTTNKMIATWKVEEFINFKAEMTAIELSKIESENLDFNAFWTKNKMNKKWKLLNEKCFLEGKAALLHNNVNHYITLIDSIIWLELTPNDEILTIAYQYSPQSNNSSFKYPIIDSWSINDNGSYDFKRGYWKVNGSDFANGWIPFDPEWNELNLESFVPNQKCPVYLFFNGTKTNSIWNRHKGKIKSMIDKLTKELNFVKHGGNRLLVNQVNKNNDKYKKLKESLESEDYSTFVSLSVDEIKQALFQLDFKYTLDQLQTSISKDMDEFTKELFQIGDISGSTGANKQTTEITLKTMPFISYLDNLANQKKDELNALLNDIGIPTDYEINTTDIEDIKELTGNQPDNTDEVM